MQMILFIIHIFNTVTKEDLLLLLLGLLMYEHV